MSIKNKIYKLRTTVLATTAIVGLNVNAVNATFNKNEEDIKTLKYKASNENDKQSSKDANCKYLPYHLTFDEIAREVKEFHLYDWQEKEIAFIVLANNFENKNSITHLANINGKNNPLVKIWNDYKDLLSKNDGMHDEVIGLLHKRHVSDYSYNQMKIQAASGKRLRVATKNYKGALNEKVVSAGSLGVTNKRSSRYYKIGFYKGENGGSCVLNVGSGDYLIGLIKSLKAYNIQKQKILNNSKKSGR
jgi:hypothetical protein